MLLRFVALSGLSLIASCSPKEGDACRLSRDCGVSLQCVEKVCRGDSTLGEFCSSTVRCDRSLDCVDNRCAALAAAGEACQARGARLRYFRDRRRCQGEFICFEKKCTSKEQKAALEAERVEDARLAEEKRMLEASGALHETAEANIKEALSPGDGSVRVVEVEGEGLVFAACRETERLIGGSCEGAAKESRPAAFSASDTIGARWSCKAGYRKNKMTAFALCALLEPPQAATSKEP